MVIFPSSILPGFESRRRVVNGGDDVVFPWSSHLGHGHSTWGMAAASTEGVIPQRCGGNATLPVKERGRETNKSLQPFQTMDHRQLVHGSDRVNQKRSMILVGSPTHDADPLAPNFPDQLPVGFNDDEAGRIQVAPAPAALLGGRAYDGGGGGGRRVRPRGGEDDPDPPPPPPPKNRRLRCALWVLRSAVMSVGQSCKQCP